MRRYGELRPHGCHVSNYGQQRRRQRGYLNLHHPLVRPQPEAPVISLLLLQADKCSGPPLPFLAEHFRSLHSCASVGTGAIHSAGPHHRHHAPSALHRQIQLGTLAKLAPQELTRVF